jgi:hypothetical protein
LSEYFSPTIYQMSVMCGVPWHACGIL